MTNRFWPAAASALLSLVVCQGPRAQAQPTPQASHNPARAWFERGLTLSERHQWAEAREAYSRSLDHQPHVSTYFNLAVVLVELGEGSAALEALGSFELLADEESAGGFLAEATSLRGRALALTGMLSLALTPDDARLVVDGMEQPESSEARRFLRLDAGTHTLRLSAPEYLSVQRSLRITQGETRELTIALEPIPKQPLVQQEPKEPNREAAVPVQASRQRDESERKRRRRTWLWTGLSVLVAGVAGMAVGMAVSRNDHGDRGEYTGSTGTVLEGD